MKSRFVFEQTHHTGGRSWWGQGGVVMDAAGCRKGSSRIPGFSRVFSLQTFTGWKRGGAASCPLCPRPSHLGRQCPHPGREHWGGAGVPWLQRAVASLSCPEAFSVAPCEFPLCRGGVCDALGGLHLLQPEAGLPGQVCVLSWGRSLGGTGP